MKTVYLCAMKLIVGYFSKTGKYITAGQITYSSGNIKDAMLYRLTIEVDGTASAVTPLCLDNLPDAQRNRIIAGADKPTLNDPEYIRAMFQVASLLMRMAADLVADNGGASWVTVSMPREHISACTGANVNRENKYVGVWPTSNMNPDMLPVGTVMPESANVFVTTHEHIEIPFL